MGVLWSERFLWIHIAGLAALPITLGLCVLGLGVGDPILPIWLELALVGGIGIGLTLWMQWQRPFYIFSVLAVALRPEQLTTNQQRVLSLFKTSGARLWTVIAALGSVVGLWQFYKIAPIAAEVVPLRSHAAGLLLATAAFLASSLFFQVPLSALRVLFIGDAKVLATEPYPVEQIKRDFTLVGLQVKQLLPPLVTESKAATTKARIENQPPVSRPSSINPQPAQTDEPEWIDPKE